MVTNAGVEGEAHGVELGDAIPEEEEEVAGARGRVSSDKVRRHDARTMENDAGAIGSWVDMYSR